MVKRYRYALVALVAGTLSFSTAHPSSAANEFMNALKDFMLKPQATDPVAAREADISNRMITAINANKLTPDQTQNLKYQFDNIKTLESRYRADGTLDSIETASLNAELNRLDGNFNSMIGNPTTTVSTGSGYNKIDVSNVRLQKLSKQITDNLANGRLTLPEAKSLKVDFDRIVNEGSTQLGSTSPDVLARFDSMMDDLQRKIRANTHDTQAWPGIDGQQAIQNQRLEDGQRSGKLSNREFTELKAESDRISQMESRARTNGLQLNEAITLATDLTSLRTQIDTRLNNGEVASGGGYRGDGQGGQWGHDGANAALPADGHGGQWGHQDPSGGYGGNQVTFDLRKDEITRRIERGVTSGRLTTLEAEDLRGDLRRLEQLVEYYRNRRGGINAGNISVLDRGQANLMADLNMKLHDDSVVVNPGSNIDRKQAELKHRIDDGVASGRLTSPEAGRLRSQLEWIDSVELSLRHSGGRLDPSEEQQLLSDLGRVEEKLNRALANGNTGGSSNIAAIESRKTDIQKRINEGVSTRRINRFEGQMINNEFNRINWMQQRLMRDGRLDQGDATRIMAELDKLNDTVNRELQDRRVIGNDGFGGFGGGHRP